MHAPRPIRALLAAVLLAGTAAAGWLDVESITNRADTSDLTCENNARAVVCDPFGRIHVVWRGEVDEALQVWYMRCPQDSTRWRDTTILSSDTAHASGPCLALDSFGDLHVAWTSGESLRVATRDSVTGAWSYASPLRGFRGDSAVSMASDAVGRQHLVWLRGSGSSACVCYVNHDASGWHDRDTVGVSHNPSGLGRPSIAAGGDGDAMVVWKDEVVDAVILSRLRVGGAWQDPEVVYDYGTSRSPCVAGAGDSSWHVVWAALGGTPSRVLWSFRAGDTWSRDTCIGAVRGDELSPSVIAGADRTLHFAWAGEPYPVSADQQVFYRRRSPAGLWSEPESLARGRATYRRRVSVASGPGTCQVTWSEWVGTHDPPAVRLRRYVMVHDVAVAAIVAQSDTADSGRAFVGLRAAVRNNGEYAEDSVVVLLRGDGYASRCTLAYLNSGAVDTARFDTCPAVRRGSYVITCSTSVAGDRQPGNDVRQDTLFVRVQDAAVAAIVSPDTVVSEEPVQPRVRVRNEGNVTASLLCHVWIDSAVYHDSVPLLVGAGGEELCSLVVWRAGIGMHVMRCSLAYAGDRRPENDTASRRFRVVQRDVGVSRILSPIGQVDSAASGTPRAVVRNHGTEVETFPVECRIGLRYADTAVVTGLPPGDSTEVEFGEWTASERGWQAVRCSTMLDGDHSRGNDAARESVFVRVVDAAVEEIQYPREVIGRGDVRVRVSVANCGNVSARVPVRARIWNDSAELRSDSLTVELAPAGDSVVEFTPWYVGKGGDYLCVCSTGLAGDMRPENDDSTIAFHVVRIDAALLFVRGPVDTVVEGRVEPELLVANQSEESHDMRAEVRILRADTLVYEDTWSRAAVPSDDTIMVRLRAWAALPGDYQVVAWVFTPDDSNPVNDSIFACVVVESLLTRYWSEMTPMPAGPRGAEIGPGGCMASAGDRLFALKGRNTCEAYCYVPAGDSWYALDTITRDTLGRGVKAGAAVACDGSGTLFALKGNRTREFWRYDIATGSWESAAALPVGMPPARFGTGLAYVAGADTGKVFCIKGGGMLDFLVYWVEQNEWHARRRLPAGPRGKMARRGTALVASGNSLFCLKGGTNEFYEYRPATDDWRERDSVPLENAGQRVRKCWDGAALAADGSGFIYALKGGRTSEFWRYEVARDTWEQLENVPTGDGSRRVRAGGALACSGGMVYCLKGRGTRDLWRYSPEPRIAAALPERSGVTGAGLGAPGSGLGQQELPGVVRAGTVLRFARAAVVRDVCGRTVATAAGRVRFDRPGVYFVQQAGMGRGFVRKVVVVR